MKSKDKQIRELKKDNRSLALIVLIGFFGGIVLFGFFATHHNNIEQQLQSYQEDLNLTFYFDTLNKNCGSSFVTKKYGDDNYYVFVNDCNKDGYCKSKYVPLEKCEVIEDNSNLQDGLVDYFSMDSCCEVISK